jgi:4-hydroxybenzoate polyprenyltransferase
LSVLTRLLISSRPISWINTAFPFAAAYYFLGGELNVFFWVTSFFFLIPYNLLMYGINDVYDYESDLRNPRKGGLEGGLLPPELHAPTLWTSFLLSAPFIVFIAAASAENVLALVAFLGNIFFVVAYSIKGLRYKEIPFIDSISSSIHFVGPAAFAIFLLGDFSVEILISLGAFFLWGAASHAFGAVQDIRADREAGIASIATVLGARSTVRFALSLYALAALLLLLLPGRFMFAALAAIPYLLVVGRNLSITDETCEQANKGWKLFIGLNFLAGAIISSLLIGPV